MKRFAKSALVALSLSMILGAKASALTVNFTGDLPSTLTAMGNSPGSAVPTSAQLSNQYEGDGVLFSSTAPYVAVVTGAGVGGGNGLGGATAAGLLSYADPVTLTFVVPGTTTPGVTNSVAIQADPDGISGQFGTLSAFDIHGNLLDQVTLNDVGSEIWTITLPGIHSARFNFPTTSTGALTTGATFGEGTGIALSNLNFGTVAAPGTGPSTVPLPRMVWGAMILIGSMAGMRLVRRQQGLVG